MINSNFDCAIKVLDPGRETAAMIRAECIH
jgi:hypothetical protein